MNAESASQSAASGHSSESRAPFDPWQPPAWFQSLSHEHAEHLVTIMELIEQRRAWGKLSDTLVRHILLESDRYIEILRRKVAGLPAEDEDTVYHVERLRQHIVITRQCLLSQELRFEMVLELLHHFVEEQVLYLDEESREKLLEAHERGEQGSRWTIGSLMGER